MTKIILIVAIAENGVIGKDNQIPWHISEDLRRFKEITMGHPIIMGRKTWESLNSKALPGRQNIVLSSQRHYTVNGAESFSSLGMAIAHCATAEKVFIIGGTAVFKEGLDIADTIELTRVHREVKGNVYFPDMDFSEWKNVRAEKRNGFSFLTYERHQKLQHSA